MSRASDKTCVPLGSALGPLLFLLTLFIKSFLIRGQASTHITKQITPKLFKNFPFKTSTSRQQCILFCMK
jgi:hypothetical protein